MKRGLEARTVVTLALMAAAILVVRNVRWRAEAQRAAAKESSESFLLPPTAELKRAALGYRAALADYLWAHVLVTQGLRLGERRRFETITNYLEAITELAPDFREPYLLADTLTTMQAKSATPSDVRAVRAILEKGAKRFPDDAELWLSLGELTVYVAPSYLDGDEEKRWRLEGAEFMARAAELGSEDAKIAWRAIGGARSLREAGQREATIRFYRRALAVTQDDELRENLERMLTDLEGERAVALQRARRSRFEAAWKTQYPTRSRSAVLLGGPAFDPARCAGGSAADGWDSMECARTWPAWYALVDSALAAEQPTDNDPAVP